MWINDCLKNEVYFFSSKFKALRIFFPKYFVHKNRNFTYNLQRIVYIISNHNHVIIKSFKNTKHITIEASHANLPKIVYIISNHNHVTLHVISLLYKIKKIHNHITL